MKTLGNVEQNHPRLGQSRRVIADCSKCGVEIPDHEMPFVLWSKDGNRMWCYCSECKKLMLRKKVRKIAP